MGIIPYPTIHPSVRLSALISFGPTEKDKEELTLYKSFKVCDNRAAQSRNIDYAAKILQNVTVDIARWSLSPSMVKTICVWYPYLRRLWSSLVGRPDRSLAPFASFAKRIVLRWKFSVTKLRFQVQNL